MFSPSSEITNPEKTSQIKVVKISTLIRVKDLLIHNTKPITFYYTLSTFRDISKIFELKGDLMKMTTNIDYNVDLASSSDKKLMYDLAKEMHFEVKAIGIKSTRGTLRQTKIITTEERSW